MVKPINSVVGYEKELRQNINLVIDKYYSKMEKNKVSFEFYKRTNQKRLKKIIELADAFILPSLYEGNPKILIEMMNHKIPIITTTVQGIKELATQRNCILIKNPDHKNIKESILKFYELNNKQKINLINNAYQASLDYSLQKICKKEFNLYTLLSEK